MGIESFFNQKFMLRRELKPSGAWGDTGMVMQEISLKGYIKHSQGQVVFEDGKPTLAATHKLFCPIATDIAPLDEVTHKGVEFKVVSVLDASGMGHHLECLLEAVR